MSESQIISWEQVLPVVDIALAEDMCGGDVTTEALIPGDQKCKARLIAQSEGILAGIGVATFVFRRVDSTLQVDELVVDGNRVHPGDEVLTVEGKVASIIRAERVALNFVQRLSAIATETAKYVEAVSGTKVLITDTRKTSPGMRSLEKYAVRIGGGHNHRQNLCDGVLIKDNHLKALHSRGVTLGEAVKQARRHAPHTLKIEVEVESVDQALEAIATKTDIVMLDNMTLQDIHRVVELARGLVMIEASGGITLDNVRSVAEIGVDLISVGAITHSAGALNFSLELEP